jgi:hypothetical protein
MTGKGKVKNKADRINLELSPWVESGIIQISDGDSPYLKALRRLFDNFFDLDPNDEAWDAGDALYHAVKLFPEVLRVPNHESLAPSAMAQEQRRGLYHPFAHVGDSTYGRPY